MSAPLIEPEDKHPDEKIEIRLRPEIARELRAYGEYTSGSSVSHVVSAALKRLFRDDKGFKSFRDANPNAGSPKVQNIRKSKSTATPGAA
ncbi:MAG: hypothetical protein ACJ746_10500 [Bryobacteraceae bacterium]